MICMKTIFPNKLKEGDNVCVIAPSCSMASLKPKNIKNLSVKRIENLLGLKVSFGKNVSNKDIFDSSSVEDRVNDLHSAFKDKNVKGVFCARGGYNANSLLPYIDWELIKNNPKPICGYSDITVLCNAIYAKTGLVTYIGPTFSTIGSVKDENGILNYILNYFKKCLMSEKSFEISPSDYFNERKINARKNNLFSVLQKGNAKGVIIGGHMSTFNLLQGTEYMPSLKNKILFIESDDFGAEFGPLEFSRDLESLLQCKDANTIKGIVFGRFQKSTGMTLDKMKFILSSKNISKSIPIIYSADFGHTMPMVTFPIGGEVIIETKGNNAKIEIIKH